MHNFKLLKGLVTELAKQEKTSLHIPDDDAPFIKKIGYVKFSCPTEEGEIDLYTGISKEDAHVSYMTLAAFSDGSEGKGGRYWFSDSYPIALNSLADLIAYSLILEGKESKTIMVPIQGFDEPQFKQLQIWKYETSNVIEIPLLTFEESTELYIERSNGYCVMEGPYPKLKKIENEVTITLGSELCIDELLGIYWLAKYGIDKLHLKD